MTRRSLPLGSKRGVRNAKRQLRGEELEQRIELVIRELAAEIRDAGKEYMYNASAVARRVPTTRKTLRRHDRLISRIVEDLAARRRMASGVVGLEQFRDQVSRLKEELAERDKVIQALREHHIEMYARFHGHSLEGEALLRPILEIECSEAGRCILCGGEVRDPAKNRLQSNIVPIRKKG